MKNKYLKLLSLVAGFAAMTASAKAADQELIDTLVQKGFLTNSEAAQISTGSSHDGVAFSAKGKQTQKIRFRGRLQLSYDYLNAENDGNLDEDRSQFYFRRVFLGAKGYLANDWVGELVMDFADQAADFDKVYIGYTGYENTEIKFGYVKVPFGMEENTSSSKLKPIVSGRTF